jgi:Ca2+/Na+ antiporter
MFPSACSFIVSVFAVSLHVSDYMAIFMCVGYLIFRTYKQQRKSKQTNTHTHTHGNNKNNGGKQRGGGNGNMQSVTT